VTPRTGTEVLDDHVERRRAVAASQVPVVDQQLPEVLRLVRRIVHLVGDHDEADRRLLVVDAPCDRMRARLLGGFDQRVLHGRHEPLLSR
jgi:hypothetical protein